MNTPEIRTLLHFMQADNYETFIDPIPAVPAAGDLIDAELMINVEECPSRTLDKIFMLSWKVNFVNWNIDNDGYYVELYLEGD